MVVPTTPSSPAWQPPPGPSSAGGPRQRHRAVAFGHDRRRRCAPVGRRLGGHRRRHAARRAARRRRLPRRGQVRRRRRRAGRGRRADEHGDAGRAARAQGRRGEHRPRITRIARGRGSGRCWRRRTCPRRSGSRRWRSSPGSPTPRAACTASRPTTSHFHEVGSWDAIADIVGVCAALADLGVGRVTASPVAVGSGRVRAAHGDLPVPPPAVLELARGWQVLAGGEGELATPTGMALLRALADGCGALPPLDGGGDRDRGGHARHRGAGQRRPRGASAPRPGTARRRRTMWVLETNVDDLDPRLWPTVLSALLAAGAADAWLVPILMKKGRPAHTLCVLAADAERAALRDAIFALTSTLGVRETPVSRVGLAARLAHRRAARRRGPGQGRAARGPHRGGHRRSSRTRRRSPGPAASRCGRCSTRRPPRPTPPGSGPVRRGTEGPLRGRCRDLSGQVARAVAVVDVDHRHPGRAAVEHREQRREALERRAVPGRRRHGHHRRRDQPGHDARAAPRPSRPPPRSPAPRAARPAGPAPGAARPPRRP